MTVKELIEILKTINENLPVATCTDNLCYFSDDIAYGTMKVSIIRHYTKDYILIGNQYKKDINKPNWYIADDIYGKTL